MGGKSLKGLNIDEKQFVRIEAMINSMTKEEKANPKIIDGSRKKRIAKGSGSGVEDVNKLLKQYFQMKKIFKNFSRFGLNKFKNVESMLSGI